MRVYFYTPHGHDLAPAFAKVAEASGHSCRTRNDTAFAGSADIERADAVVVLPGRPLTGLIASEYHNRKIAVTTACEGESPEQLLVRVIKSVITSVLNTNTEGFHELSKAGSSAVAGRHLQAEPSQGVTDQGSEPNAGEGASALAAVEQTPITSAPSVEESPNATGSRRNRQGRSK